MPASALALLVLLAASAPVAAQGWGLAVTQPETVWPHWQARVAVQTAGGSAAPLRGGDGSARSPAALPFEGTGAAGRHALLGGALLGDYTFAQPAFGRFRASGGLVVGAAMGVPWPVAGDAASPAVLGWSLLRGSSSAAAAGWGTTASADEPPAAAPYLGLGFSRAWWGDTLALSADVGYVAERTPAMGGVGRALLGQQGLERTLRELRLSPVVQLGLRYAF